MTSLVFTPHAKARLDERGMSPSEVIATVMHGSFQPDREGRLRFSFFDSVVILDGATVITTFRRDRRTKKVRRKPKRKQNKRWW